MESELLATIGSRDWRISSGKLYKIIDKQGRLLPFIPNRAQESFRKSMHLRNIILKARQLGFSTYLEIFLTDRALFEMNQHLGVIAHTLDDANDLFENKIRVAYENLPESLRKSLPVRTDRTGEMRFANGSTLSVGNSFRGGTLQHLHVSEFGKICAKYPDKAREIVTGAFNTVADGMRIDVESTAEGSSGPFFDMCMEALDRMRSSVPLSPTDFKFHFFPWYDEPSYRSEVGDHLKDSTKDYFAKLRQDDYVRKNFPHITFDEPMMRWWQNKYGFLKEDMLREYPSTPKEAFEMAVKGAYYEAELTESRENKRIGLCPHDRRLKVYTAWDIGGAGGGDDTAVWFFQVHGKEVRFIDYWEGSGYSIVEAAGSVVKGRGGYNYELHFFPHDAEVHDQTDGTKRIDAARRILGSCTALPLSDVADGINQARDVFRDAWFHEPSCDKGLKHLASYCREWDARNGCFRDKPKHDAHSHCADAFRYAALAVARVRSGGSYTDLTHVETDYSDLL